MIPPVGDSFAGARKKAIEFSRSLPEEGFVSMIVEARNVDVAFPGRAGFLPGRRAWQKVLQNVSVSIERGKTLGLVGESGSGKTTLGRAILGLIPVQAGQITYNDVEGKAHAVSSMSRGEMQPLRKRLQIVFQDPFSSLNPRMRVQDILEEGLRFHEKSLSADGRRARVTNALDQVGLPASSLPRYPHEFSGGQRQRISIARALVLEPDFIVCDECVSALDVSIQAQIINLLIDLQDKFGLSYLFISHDVSVVRHISHTVAVLHKGEVVEYGNASDVVHKPTHPYTKSLIAAIPGIVPVH